MFKKKTPKNKKTAYNHYSYLQAIGLSFYSPNIYIDAAKRWTGFGGIYLLLLCFILSAPPAFQFVQKTLHYFSDELEPGLKEMPTLVIKDKKVSFQEEKTKGITAKTNTWIWPPAPSAEHPRPEIVINLPRSIESFQSVFIPILITQDYIQIQSFSPLGKEAITDEIKIDKEDDGILGPEQLGKIVNQIKFNLISSAYPYLSWFMWALIFVSILFFSSLANVLYFAIYRTKLPFLQAVRVFCIAATPALVLLEILYFSHKLTQWWLIFSGVVLLGYYFVGVRACKFDTEPVIQ
jgi:hypothetical protein